MSNTNTIRDFINAWSRLDPDELAEYFAEDGAYHNMPMQPVVGKENIKTFIQQFLANWTQTHWEILNIVESDGIVYCERVDKTKTTAGDVDLPCFGVFEMESEMESGTERRKIRVWRDYFDLGTFTNAMS